MLKWSSLTCRARCSSLLFSYCLASFSVSLMGTLLCCHFNLVPRGLWIAYCSPLSIFSLSLGDLGGFNYKLYAQLGSQILNLFVHLKITDIQQIKLNQSSSFLSPLKHIKKKIPNTFNSFWVSSPRSDSPHPYSPQLVNYHSLHVLPSQRFFFFKLSPSPLSCHQLV